MDKKESFTMLYDALRDGAKLYNELIFKTLATLILVLGWLMTSGDTREFIKTQANSPFPIVFILLLATTALMGLLHTFFSFFYHSLSQKILAMLGKISYVDEEHYKHYSITLTLVLSNLVVNLTLYIIIFVTIFMLKW